MLITLREGSCPPYISAPVEYRVHPDFQPLWGIGSTVYTPKKQARYLIFIYDIQKEHYLWLNIQLFILISLISTPGATASAVCVGTLKKLC